jgi:tetratricopeptide (TPR) repeat protein
MKTFQNDESRRLAPRWRSLSRTEQASELGSLQPSLGAKENRDALILHKVALWREQPTVALAADVVSAGLVLGLHAAAAEAAEFLLHSRAAGSDHPLSRIAAQVAGVDLAPDSSVSSPRSLLFLNPRNGLAWVELARLQASSGAPQKASSSMSVALALEQDNRFVLRSASRLAIHLGDPQYASFLIRRSDVTRLDPWLVAAEVAASNIAGNTSPLIRVGRKMISGAFAASDISELAASLAQLELANGNVRQARKLFAKAVEMPTDNTAAQLEWDARKETKLAELVQSLDVRGRLFAEARALEAFRRGEWKKSMSACTEWLEDEPFSTRPAIFGTVVGAVCLSDFEAGAKFAEKGLRANPLNITLLNNLAFSLASLNRIEEARLYHQRLTRLAGRSVVSLATGGLIMFRSGDFDGARCLYEEAVRAAEGEENRFLRAMARAYRVREEVIAGSGQADAILPLARIEGEELRGDELLFFESVMQQITDLRANRSERSKPD